MSDNLDATVSPFTRNPRHQDAWFRGVAVATRLRPFLVLAAAIGVPVAVSAGLLPYRADVSSATQALSLAIAVSLVAAAGTRLAAAVAAVAAAACFDFFFTKPYGSFWISSVRELETAALLLVGSLIVGQLAARNRTNKGLVAQTSDDLSRVQAVAELLASGAAADDVVSAVGDELQSLLGLRAWRFETSFPGTPSPTIERSGGVSWGRFWWGFRTLGLPGKEITLAVEHQQRRRGRYVLLAEPGAKVTRDQLLTAVTLADQAGIALGVDAMRT